MSDYLLTEEEIEEYISDLRASAFEMLQCEYDNIEALENKIFNMTQEELEDFVFGK